MNNNHVRYSIGTLFLIGGIALLDEKSLITAAVTETPSFSLTFTTLLSIIFFLISITSFISKEPLEALITYVKGTNPVTKKISHSPLYSKIDDTTIDEVFQTSLDHKFGKNIKGAKAIVYKANDGKYHVAFLTEAIDTHHRHAAATVARLVEGIDFNDPSYQNEKIDALYEGDSARACELLTQCAGFELQYDLDQKKIIGIQQDSWLTKEQQRCGRMLNKNMEEDMILELLSKIENKYLNETIKNLDEEGIRRLYAERIAA